MPEKSLYYQLQQAMEDRTSRIANNKEECKNIANLLMEKLAEYLGCSPNFIRFLIYTDEEIEAQKEEIIIGFPYSDNFLLCQKDGFYRFRLLLNLGPQNKYPPHEMIMLFLIKKYNENFSIKHQKIFNICKDTKTEDLEMVVTQLYISLIDFMKKEKDYVFSIKGETGFHLT